MSSEEGEIEVCLYMTAAAIINGTTKIELKIFCSMVYYYTVTVLLGFV